jgi:hypothetical protein
MDYIRSPTNIMALAGIKRTIKNALGSAPAGGMNSENSGELVKMIDEFLPSEDFIAFQRWAYQVDCCKTRADYQWAEYLVRDFAECKISEPFWSNNPALAPDAQNFLTQLSGLVDIAEQAAFQLMIYRWQPTSGIGMHTDGNHDVAFTFYLNDNWDPHWGGDFIYYDNIEAAKSGTGRSIQPMGNRLMMNRGGSDHKISYTSQTAPERVTAQIFVRRDSPFQ